MDHLQKTPRQLADCDDLFERRLVEEIERQGYSVVHLPEGCYTVGLWAHRRRPDAIVYGLPAERGQALLDNYAALTEQPGAETRDLTEEFALRVRLVQPHHYREHMPYGRWFYRGEGFSAVQLVWPDPDGRFASQSDVPSRLDELQPDLSI